MINPDICTGCSACIYHCPTNAIAIEQNFNGFFYAKINNDLCINCNRCNQICPQTNLKNKYSIKNASTCYAMVANEPYLSSCSSGGIFGLLGNEFIKNNGFVSGAFWGENFRLQHGVAQNEEDLKLLLGSKYVQSNMADTFPIIKDLLDLDSAVLFCGTPCQVAGLLAFLEKDYTNLFTIDFACHGVPSPYVLDKYISHIEHENGTIKNFSFRNKEFLGWYPGFHASFEDGHSIIENMQDNLYMSTFLNNWTLNESCFDCNYKDYRCSDLTLGDFWGIDQIYDGAKNGVSFVLPHSQAGIQLIRMILPKIKDSFSLPLEFAILYNQNLIHSVERPFVRDSFLDNLHQDSFDTAYKKLIHDNRFDYGMILWWSNNYGNALTNYALYKVIIQLGYSVLAVDSFVSTKTDAFQKFAKQNFLLSSNFISQADFNLLENFCDNYIVGSDQTWNYYLTERYYNGQYYGLAFASDSKRKVAYAPSFASRNSVPTGDLAKRYGAYYNRFDAISVREKFAVDACKKEFGLDVTWVIDPVFLLTQENYSALSQKPAICNSDEFLTVYVLDITPEKVSIVEYVESMLNIKDTYWIVDMENSNNDVNKDLIGDRNLVTGAKIENWLYLISNAKFVITDSFHGTCFSIIFKKQFISIKNRDTDRFTFFDEIPEINENVVDTQSLNDLNNFSIKNINYELVDLYLEPIINDSYLWLKNALKK